MVYACVCVDSRDRSGQINIAETANKMLSCSGVKERYIIAKECVEYTIVCVYSSIMIQIICWVSMPCAKSIMTIFWSWLVLKK